MTGYVVVEEPTLRGKISSEQTLISGKIASEQVLISGKLCSNYSGEEYSGEYIITPKFSEQTMLTEDKHLSNNIIIETIPYSEVTNCGGGLTINIGG